MRRLSGFYRSYYCAPKRHYDAVIVGGGHNGLTAAAYLQKSGFKVCVLEKRHIIGGAAVTEEIVPGFKFSRASYVLSLLRPCIYQDLKLKEFGLNVLPRDQSSYTPLREEFWSSEARSLLLGTNASDNFKEISKFSKKDAAAYPKYEAQLSRIAEAIDPLLDLAPNRVIPALSGSLTSRAFAVAKDPSLRRAAQKLFNLGVDVLPLFDLMTTSPLKMLRRWFESEVLIATLAMDAVIGTMDSPSAPGSGYVLLLHSILGECGGERGRWGYPVGGMGSVSNAIAASATALGADIFPDHTVTKIMTDSNGAARGIRTADGLEISSKVVLANTTPKVTFNLIDAGTVDPTYQSALDAIDYSSSVTKINVAVKDLPNFEANPNIKVGRPMPHHQTTIHINSERMSCLLDAHKNAEDGQVSSRPLIEMVIPSVVDQTIAPNGGHVCLLFTQYTPYAPKSNPWDDASKEAYAKSVFRVIDEYAPGFSGSVIGKEVLTPPDLENIFGLTGGNIFHGAMTPDRLLLQRPVHQLRNDIMASPFTTIPRLLLCGSGAHPGGGVSGSPGRIAALEAISLLRKRI